MQRDATTKQPNENRMSTKSNARDMRDPLWTAETPFLVELFRRLDEAEVKYCVLRNYEGLPYDLRGSDVDVLVDESHAQGLQKLIVSTAKDFNGRCVSKIPAHRVMDLMFCGYYEKKWWGVRFDIMAYAGTNGCDLLDAEHVLNRTQVYNGIRVAQSSDAALLGFLKEIVGSGQIDNRYRREAMIAYTNEHALFARMLRRTCGKSLFDGDILPLLRGVDRRSRTGVRFRRAWKAGYFKRYPMKALKALFSDYLCRWWRIRNRSGIAIAVMGTDGSGKSALIEEIRPVIDKALHTKSTYEHMRPNLLPSLARLFGRPVKEGPTTDPHAGKPSGFLVSIIRLLYYTTDYVIGYWLKVFPALVKRPCMYVFDRYFYDYQIDPYRSLISLPRWITNALSLFIPKPDIILCLGADPEIIHARKPELPLEEFKRQIKALRQFCDKNKRAVWIDTGCSIEDSVNQALEAITTRMAARYE